MRRIYNRLHYSHAFTCILSLHQLLVDCESYELYRILRDRWSQTKYQLWLESPSPILICAPGFLVEALQSSETPRNFPKPRNPPDFFSSTQASSSSHYIKNLNCLSYFECTSKSKQCRAFRLSKLSKSANEGFQLQLSS